MFSTATLLQVQTGVSAGVLLLLWLLETWLPLFVDRPHRLRHALRNLGIGGLNLAMVFVGTVITVGLMFGFGAISIFAAVRCRKGSDAFLIVASTSGLVVCLVQGLECWAVRAAASGASYAPFLAGLDAFVQLWNPVPLWEAARALPS